MKYLIIGLGNIGSEYELTTRILNTKEGPFT